MKSNEARIKGLLQELSTAQKALAEKEEEISQLRVEVYQSQGRVFNAKVCCHWRSGVVTLRVLRRCP